MKRSPAIASSVLVIGVSLASLVRFSQHTRSVDAVGLFAAGTAFGIALLRLMQLRRMRSQT